LITFIFRPVNKEELFNLRHSGLRNHIERSFGILKRRFQILRFGSEYAFATQVSLVRALCGLHNFIRVTDGEDDFYNLCDFEPEDSPQNYDVEHGAQVIPREREIAVRMRDEIANQMWIDYKKKMNIIQK